MPRAVVGISGLTFDVSHYTKGASSKCMNIHGHTFKLSVEVEGFINEDTGMVIDFIILKKIVREIINEYDHKVIVPKKDVGKISIKGPFNAEMKVIDYPEATTEYIALDIAKRIYEKLKMPVRVKLYEGENNYVIITWGFEQSEQK
ncbi:MAG: 6-carboxytetrahydropterin synthase [Thermoprotei archaeon]|nr:MAG: 6-carboxytetrahydropterin synthase [Thermoprotei archaeon]